MTAEKSTVINAATGSTIPEKNAVEKRFSLSVSSRLQRHGNNCALGEILKSDAYGQRECRRNRDFLPRSEKPRKYRADSHPLGHIVQSDG